MGTIYQVSTISALSLGYTKSVITVEELLRKGGVGLGTYEDVNGEMIVIDDVSYQAQDDGSTYVADGRMGASFAAVGFLKNQPDIRGIQTLFENGFFRSAVIDLPSVVADQEEAGIGKMVAFGNI